MTSHKPFNIYSTIADSRLTCTSYFRQTMKIYSRRSYIYDERIDHIYAKQTKQLYLCLFLQWSFSFFWLFCGNYFFGFQQRMRCAWNKSMRLLTFFLLHLFVMLEHDMNRVINLIQCRFFWTHAAHNSNEILTIIYWYVNPRVYGV